ncbi:MAG: hypothetical protein HUJ87_15590 [Fusobacterium varium]|uniref:hypothetical protein n=1 Tax=Fusobacterium varium TaxID=856 RepID=UPI00242C567C|nr:hypothetical protein [Fusobacterium varium]MCF0171913.1 hypothetical protein [Fusobacterium varium]
MKMDLPRIRTLLECGKEVDVTDFTVRQLLIVQNYLKSYSVGYSKKLDSRNFRMFLISYKDLTELVSRERGVL